MRHHWIPALMLSTVLAAPAMASMGGSSMPSTPSSSSTPTGSDEPTLRQLAERDYGDAYSEIAKAKKDIEDKKDANAQKRFQKALSRARDAVTKDSTYFEAWNLVGYASRKTGKYDDAVAAYVKCLGIAFDYAPAREYLGEAYLEMNKPDLARAQLAMLERLKATDQAAELKSALDTYAAAHPEAATPAPDASAASTIAPPATTSPAVAAPADSASAK